MILYDLFEQTNTGLSIQYNTSASDAFYANFLVTPTDEVRISIEADGNPPIWDFSFDRGVPGKAGTMIAKGQGSQHIVFGAVLEVMKAFMSQHSPQFVTFAAHHNEPARARLYQAMIQRYAGTWGMRWVQDPTNDTQVPDSVKQEVVRMGKYQTVFLLVRG